MKPLIRRVKFWLRREQFEREMDEEMRYHLARKAEEFSGADDSAEAAARQFGNVVRMKEESRQMWTGIFWEQFAQDVRYGLRAMAGNPLFTGMAVLSLALGIGANAAIYSFVDAILMRSLPVARPDELVVVNWRAPEHPKLIHSHTGSSFRDGKKGVSSPNYPWAAYELLRKDSTSLSTLFAYASVWDLNLAAHKQADVADALAVSGTFFHDLGLAPAAGRFIGDDDDRAGAAPVVVLSYKYWQRRFSGDAGAIGQSILINDVPMTIAGVAPPDFFGVDPGKEPLVYVALHTIPLFPPNSEEEKQRRFFSNMYWVEMMGRLRPGVTLAQAQAELGAKFQVLAASTAKNAEEKKVLPSLWLEPGAGGLDSLRRQYSEPVYILMAMVGLILAVACANLANLLLARAQSRRREMAVRVSLGAGRGRVIRQLLTESVMLSLIGAVPGVLIALWGIRSITWLLANGREDFTLRASLNWPVLGFTFGLAVLTGIVFGLAPALRATKVDLTTGLKATATGARTRRRGIGVSQLLVVGQFAISLVLVVGAGLFTRTIANLHAVDLGFNRENLLVFSMNARQAGYQDQALVNAYTDLLRRFNHIPGVQQASLAQYPLASQFMHTTDLHIAGVQPKPGAPMGTSVMSLDPTLLANLQIPILAGRPLGEHDLTSPRVAIVNEKLVQKYFPHENPIGRRIAVGDISKDNPADVEIVGIAKTTIYNSVKEAAEETPPLVYLPFSQNLERLGQVYFFLRTSGDPLAVAGMARRIVQQVNPLLAVSNVDTLAAKIDQTIAKERTFAEFCTGFALLALVIACVGLYGTIAYAVSRRTSEIGIRMALGAERRRIVWMVLREVLALVAVGLAIGVGTAWGTTRFVESFLFGLKQHDARVLVGAVLVMGAAAFAAGYGPARRASRIDPMAALRHE